MSSIKSKTLAAILGLATIDGVTAWHQVKEYELSAEIVKNFTFPGPDGLKQDVYAYKLKHGGSTLGPSVPGPLIEGNVGDILKIHFTNNLDEETTVHFHGMEVPAVMDGSPISQHAVRPGECFDYEFELLRAATYWYHPHIASDKFVEKGLYGPLVVRDPTQDKRLGPYREFIAMLDDVRLDEEDGLVSPHLSQQASARDRAEMLLNGRIGIAGGDMDTPVRLVNNNKVPVENVMLQQGETIRIRFVNVANTLFFRLSFPCQEVWKIASDGGLFPEPVKIEAIDTVDGVSDPDLTKGILMTPGERVEILSAPTYDAASCNGNFVVEWHDMPIGLHNVTIDENTGKISADHSSAYDGKRPKQALIKYPVDNSSPVLAYEPPSGLVNIHPIHPKDCLIVYSLAHGGATKDGYVPFYGQKDANGNKLSFDHITSRDAPVVEPYEKCYIDVENADGHDHNFHLHGFHFLLKETRVVYKDGTQTTTNNEHLEWHDTIHCPRRPEAEGKTVLRLAVQFGYKHEGRDVLASGKCPTEETSGGWLVHCHMLEHGDYGMASFLQVIKKDSSKSSKSSKSTKKSSKSSKSMKAPKSGKKKKRRKKKNSSHKRGLKQVKVQSNDVVTDLY